MSAHLNEHAPSSVESLDQLSQADLLSRREALDAELDRTDKELSEYLEKLKESNDPQLAILEQLEADRDSDKNEITEGSTYSYMIEHGEDLLSTDLITTFKKIESLDATEDEVVAQLDKRFAPGLMQYARKEAGDLIHAIDYVAAGTLANDRTLGIPDNDGIRLKSNEQTLPHPQQVIEKLGRLVYEEPTELNYRYAELQVDEIERSKQILERWGVGSKKPLRETVNDYKEMERAEQLNTRYRKGYHQEISPILAESKPNLPMHEWAVNLPEEEVAKYYEYLAAIDIEKELERVKIEGTELLPFEFSDEELRDYIRSHIPAIALEGLTDIVFMKTPDEVKDHYSSNKLFEGKGIAKAHHSFSLKDNNSKIEIFMDPFHKMYETWKQAHPKSEVEGWVKAEVLDTIAHELGHALHHTLPVSILNEWDEVARNETRDVSAYVSEMNKIEHGDRFTEDFADSFTLYVNQPLELQNKAAKRYETMQAMVTKLKK